MDRKAIANETLRIMKQGFYEYHGNKVDIHKLHKTSIDRSVLILPEEVLEKRNQGKGENLETKIIVENISTVKAILDYHKEGKKQIGVLNFASAKNPGGGFLNGANAQEESLAASSGLYETLLTQPNYYKRNRECNSMMYTDYAIYSPDVVFFRDEKFHLLESPKTASVLTLPAVNYGQVILKGEDTNLAKQCMKKRMKRSLEIFAEMGEKYLVLGAYGCGVFRNDPKEVAFWWKELLENEYDNVFEQIVFAVYDKSKEKSCIQAFENLF